VYGNHDVADIEAVDVGNLSIFRERVGRLFRKIKCYSKMKRCFWNALTLFMFYWGFISNKKRYNAGNDGCLFIASLGLA
jgi:hypothetical protein